MKRNEKKRHAASNAVIALRNALGKTQQEFAVEVVKTAIGTVAVWETTRPPRGEALLRLADVADRAQSTDPSLFESKTLLLTKLGDVFRRLYLDEVKTNLGDNRGPIVGHVDGKEDFYLFIKLNGPDQLKIAWDLINLINSLRGGKRRGNAIPQA
jgi:hypothetical protein